MKPSVDRLSALLVVVLSLAVLRLPRPVHADTPATDPNPVPGVHFVHVATADNIHDNWTYLDHPKLNGDQSAIFFVTQNWNPSGMSGTYNDEAIGVWYSGTAQKWAIFNQDQEVAMPEDAAFNVHIPVEDSTVFVHEATPANSVGHITYIDHPYLNGNPGATVFVTQNWNPPGEPGVYNDHEIGVSYSDYDEKWYLFNQDFANVPDGASFNILLASEDETAISHIATSDSLDGHLTRIDDDRINGNPNALLTVTQNWYPTAIFNNHAIGLYFLGPYWYIFNQDTAAMPVNAAFNILIPRTDSAAYVHVATSSNSAGNVTYLDHHLLNGNPDAIVLATQNWNPNGTGGVDNGHHIGVWYDSSTQGWSIFNQDVEDMPEGAAFNILVPAIGANTFTHVTTAENHEDHVTYVDHPESNGDPSSLLLFTPNWNPWGLGDTYNDHATGVWYSELQQKASIYNEDLAEMPIEAAFNVHIPDDDAIVFVHTATADNTVLNWTYLDHPSLNRNPYALVYVTHNWNPGGGLAGVYDEQALGVWYEDYKDQWAVFNEIPPWVAMPVGIEFNVLVIPEHRVFLPLVRR